MSSVRVSTLLGTIGSFPLFRAVGCLAWLSCTYLSPRSCLFLPGPANDRFLAADVQHDPTILSSVLPAPPTSSLCLDVNEETDLQATGSPSCWSLHLFQMNKMWGGEPSELLVAKGYWIAIGAKPLHVVDETFYSITTDNAIVVTRIV